MQLYAGTSKQFIEDVSLNRIAEKLRQSFFFHFHYYPGDSEVRSWQNSLSRICNVVQLADLNDHGVLLEYQLPLTSKRLDFMITGVSSQGEQNAVIVELKQWEEAGESSVDECVTTFVAGRVRDVLHPSVQVGRYRQYLVDCHTAFQDGGVALNACAFLHNYWRTPDCELLNSRHSVCLEEYPLFTADETEGLAAFVSERVSRGDGSTVLARVLESKYRPSKKLLDHTAAMIAGQTEYVLLDEQQVVFNKVLSQVTTGFRDRNKVVILVRGGPGTGKSVIALQLVGELSKRGYNAQHATGSKAFTGNVRRLVGSRASAQIRFFNSYVPAERDEIDVLVLDEAHRIRESSHNRFTPRAKRSEGRQVDELVSAARVSVFFIDDRQVVRPKEVGSSDLIRSAAVTADASLFEYELEAQFRCQGSDGFINWVDNTLDVRPTANILWNLEEEFDFRIVESVEDLDALIRERSREGWSARLAAGFCWKWSDPLADGSLVDDVVVGTWSMPWNAREDAGKLAKGIPKSDFWASDPLGIEQVGCVYTAQGFEFDYVGVIFGFDLRYDPVAGSWIGDSTESQDSVVKRSGDSFLNLVKNTYRVLLTRGLKGCYVTFLDQPTRDFVRSRLTGER
jgi:hypothetical protein